MSENHRAPLFSSYPDQDKLGPTIEVIRIPPRGLRGIIVASHDPLGCYTHWRNNRKVPCLGTSCKCNQTGEERRWYGYLAIWQPRTSNMAILEYTRAAALAIKEYFDRHRTLRGAQIDAHRRSEKINSRLVLNIYEGRYPKEDIPKAPNRQQILCRMWGLRFEEFDDSAHVAELQAIQQQLNEQDHIAGRIFDT